MTKNILLIFIIFPFWGLSQHKDSISYTLVFKECCTEEITIYKDYYVTDELGNKYEPHNNLIKLEKGKKYFLNNEGHGILKLPISTENNSNNDTIITSCLTYKNPGYFFTWNPIHLACEDTLNGQYTEYYTNKVIRLRGNFLNGKVSDSLLNYYSNGKLKSLIVFINADTIYKTFYPNGQLSHVYQSNKRNTISYFEDGSIKCKRSHKKMKEFNRFSKNQFWYKIKPNKQVAFYKNGIKDEALKRKPLLFWDRFKLKNNDRDIYYRYTWTSYDSIGKKAKEVLFYSKYALRLYTGSLYQSLRDFSTLTYYENEKLQVTFYVDIYKGENISYPVMYHIFYNGENQSYYKDLLPYEFDDLISEYESNYRAKKIPRESVKKQNDD